MLVAGLIGTAGLPHVRHAVGINAFELLVDAKVALHGEQRAATLAGQVRVALSSTGNLVSGLAVFGPLGDSARLGLAEVVARGVLAEVDLDAAVLGRYAGGCRLLLVVLITLDGLVEGIDGAATSPEAGEDFLVKNPPAKIGNPRGDFTSWTLIHQHFNETARPTGPARLGGLDLGAGHRPSEACRTCTGLTSMMRC